MNIIFPTGLSTPDPSATTFNSREKDSNEDPVIKEKYGMKILPQVPKEFYKLSFDLLKLNDVPVNLLKAVEKILWH